MTRSLRGAMQRDLGGWEWERYHRKHKSHQRVICRRLRRRRAERAWRRDV